MQRILIIEVSDTTMITNGFNSTSPKIIARRHSVIYTNQLCGSFTLTSM